MKTFKIIEHLSDTGISAGAGNVEELFEVCAFAMFSVICKIVNVGTSIKKKIVVPGFFGANLDDLLVLWLEKLIYYHEVNKLLFSSFKVLKVSCGKDNPGITAVAYGEKINLKKHEIFLAVKAPTYHMLEVKKDDKSNRWRARVIFDV